METIHVAIAEDQLLFRKGMIALLDTFENVEVLFEAGNGRQLLEQCPAYRDSLHVVLLDLSMPEMDGLETLKVLKKEYPEVKVIMITVHEGDNFITALIEAGANGYLAKNAEPEEVETAIRTVFAHDFYFNEATLTAMRQGLIKGRKRFSTSNPASLTTREKEVLQLICKQCSNTEIAEHLNVSVRTVEGHRNNLLLKTESRNTAGLVLFAINHNLLMPVF